MVKKTSGNNLLNLLTFVTGMGEHNTGVWWDSLDQTPGITR
jgi:hypothetical protein